MLLHVCVKGTSPPVSNVVARLCFVRRGAGCSVFCCCTGAFFVLTVQAFRTNRVLPLESAEGCYSLAAASDESLKIKFTVKVHAT